MPKKKRVMLMRFNYETGGLDTTTGKRLPNICYGIYNRKTKRPIFSGRRTVSLTEYNKKLRQCKK